MVGHDSIELRKRARQAHYLSLSSSNRAALALEMTGEVLEHYDRARSLISAMVTQLEAIGEESKPALHLAQIAESWMHDAEYLDQEERLLVCLKAMGVSHG